MELLKQGTKLHIRYEIDRVIGQGGFGVTYLAEDTELRHTVVIKEYYPRALASRSDQDNSTEVLVSAEREDRKVYERGKKDFLDEARRMSELFHIDAIVKVLDYFEENGTAYLVMEYIRGVSLSAWLERLDIPMTFDEAWDLLRPVAIAMRKVHQEGIIHRDLNPSNLIMTEKGTLKIIDFGASRSFADNEKTMTILVKKGYTPPEQYMKEKHQGPWTDVYALCATLYEMITGVKPDSCVDRMKRDELYLPSAYGAEITPEQEQALVRGLELDYKKRYTGMQELLNDIEQDKKEVEEQRPVHRRFLKILVGCAGVLLLAAAAGYMLVAGNGQDSGPVYAGSYEYQSEEYLEYMEFLDENAVSETMIKEINDDVYPFVLSSGNLEERLNSGRSKCYKLPEEAVIDRNEPCNSLRFFVNTDDFLNQLSELGYSFEKIDEETFCNAIIFPYRDILTQYMRMDYYCIQDQIYFLVCRDLVNDDLLRVHIWTKTKQETGEASAGYLASDMLLLLSDKWKMDREKLYDEISKYDDYCTVDCGIFQVTSEDENSDGTGFLIVPLMQGYGLYYNP